MSHYKSQPVVVNKPASYIVEKFADLSTLGSAMDNLPAEERAKIGDVKFDKDSVTIDTKQVGSVSFKVVERTPSRIVMEAVGSPLPISLNVDLKSVGDESTELVVAIDADVPVFLRPMVGGIFQKAVDQLGGLMAKLNA